MSQYDPFQGFAVTVAAAGTAVELSPQPYDNTRSMLVYNPSANDVYLRWQSSNAAIASTQCVFLAAGASVDLFLGPKSQRPSSGANTLWADASVGGTTFYVTYTNGVEH